MRYFTRELADAVGRGSPAAYARWRRASERYELYRSSVVAAAGRDVRALVLSSFHDCVLAQVYMDPKQLTLILTGTRSWLASRRKLWGVHRLEFRGVTASTLGVQHVGCSWGYEELRKKGSDFELNVLLNDSGDEFRVRFRTVRLRSTPLSSRSKPSAETSSTPRKMLL